MVDLYKMSFKEASEEAIETIMAQCGVSKAKATEVFKNTLIYNAVIDEIVGQAMFLLGMDDEENEIWRADDSLWEIKEVD